MENLPENNMFQSTFFENIPDVIRWKNKKIIDVSGISISSKSMENKNVFLALNGARYRGSQFIAEAISNGAELIISEVLVSEVTYIQSLIQKYPHVVFLQVRDGMSFLQKLTKAWVDYWKSQDSNNFLIGIAGSNGKTTSKEMIYHLLDKIFPGKVLATQGNFNNHVGVPLTLLNLRQKHRIGVIELGTNQKGDIDSLTDLFPPDAGLLTNIGPEHLEGPGSIEGVFEEEFTLYKKFLTNPNKKIFVLNGNDYYLSKVESDAYTYKFTGSLKNQCVHLNIK